MDVTTDQYLSTMDAVRVEDRWVVPCSDALDRARGLTVRMTAEETVLGFPAGSTATMSPGHVRAVCLLAELTDPPEPLPAPDQMGEHQP